MKTEEQTEAHMILNAEIDEVRMFQTTGTPAIQTQKAMKIHSGIVAEWRLTEGPYGAEKVRNEFISNLQNTQAKPVNGRSVISFADSKNGR